MKVTVLQTLNAVSVLAQLVNNQANVQLPAKAAYRIARLTEKLTREAQLIDTRRNDLIIKYGAMIVGEDGATTGNYEVKDRMPEFLAEWNPLLAEEIEIDVQPMPLDTLGDTKILTVAEMLQLGPFVTE